jgi:UrcA family protein
MKSTFAGRCALIGMTTIALGMGVGHAYAAGPDFETRTLRVRFQDLDLSQPRDAQRLYQRIQTAAREVCDNGLLMSLDVAAKEYTCREQAVTHAVEQIGSARLTQIHQSATQRLASRG